MKKALAIVLFAAVFAACNNYGKKIEYGKGELYYTDKVTEAEAKNLGKYLQDVEMFPEGKAVSYQIDKEGEKYIFKLIVSDEKYTTDQSYLDKCQLMGGFFSHEAFAGKPVEYWLCDDKFEPLKKVEFKALPDSILKQMDLEAPNNGTTPGGNEPKDDVIPVDTSQGQPA